MTVRDLSGVVVGAVAGAAVRWVLAELVGARPGLLTANALGCALIGWATTRPDPGPWLTAGWCGALTSFSALSLQLAIDIDEGSSSTALAWLAITAVGCAFAFLSGRRHGATRTEATS